MGANLPSVRKGAGNIEGMVEGNALNWKDSTLDLVSSIPGPVRAKTARTGPLALRGLPSLEQGDDT